MSDLGRNAPCPCGSGKKYKKCCLRADEAQRDAARAARQASRDANTLSLDAHFALLKWSERAGYDVDFSGSWVAFPPEGALLLQLLETRASLWFGEPDQPSPLDRYLAAQPPAKLARVLRARQSSWLGLWQIEAVEGSGRIAVRDRLSGERRVVVDYALARTAEVHSTFVGLLVDDARGRSAFDSVSPWPQDAFWGEDLERGVRDAAADMTGRPLDGPIPLDVLRTGTVVQVILDQLERVLHEVFSGPSELDLEGEPIELTTTHYTFPAAKRRPIEAWLSGECGAPSVEGSRAAFVLTHEAGGDLAQIVVAATTLTLNTPSAPHRVAARAWIEGGLGASLTFERVEHHALPESAAPTRGPAIGEVPPPEVIDAMRSVETGFYSDWTEQGLPALGGLTPREAVATADGRRRVEVVLQDFEQGEARKPAWQRFGIVATLRARLGLDR